LVFLIVRANESRHFEGATDGANGAQLWGHQASRLVFTRYWLGRRDARRPHRFATANPPSGGQDAYAMRAGRAHSTDHFTDHRSLGTQGQGLGCGVGRSRCMGTGRGVGVGRTVAVGDGVGVAVGVGVTVGVGVGAPP
jgi:hypothetical protein